MKMYNGIYDVHNDLRSRIDRCIHPVYLHASQVCVCVCVQILHVTCVYIEPTAGTLERDGEGRGEKN